MVSDTTTGDRDMLGRYKNAVEHAIARLPVKNGVVDIDAIWIETSLPLELLQQILRRDDLELPENVERVNLKPRKPPNQGERRGTRTRSKRKRKR